MEMPKETIKKLSGHHRLAKELLFQLRERHGSINYENLRKGILELVGKGLVTLDELGSSLEEIDELCRQGARTALRRCAQEMDKLAKAGHEDTFRYHAHLQFFDLAAEHLELSAEDKLLYLEKERRAFRT